jgi:hypothetical protein
MAGRALANTVGALAALLVAGGCGFACGPAAPATATARSEGRAQALLPDVRRAKDRPPVVLVVREGDPSSALALAVTTAALEGADDDPEIAVALAGMIEGRLAAKGLAPIVMPSWSGYRVAVLIPSADAAASATDALREALTATVDDRDVVLAKKKLAALAGRPLRDASLARYARCVGSPHALPQRAGKSGDDLSAPRLERWRAAAHGLGRVAISVAAPRATAESVAAAIARGPAWKAGAPAAASTNGASGTNGANRVNGANGAIDVDVYEEAAEMSGSTVIHATLDVGTGSEAVSTADALGDPHGPLASRLAALDLPFRLREVVGTAEPRGGCVGIVLEAAAPTSPSASPSDVATRVADAVALVHVEAQVHLAEGGSGPDGRTLARRAGDAREAAERAAWWALADTWTSAPPASAGTSAGASAGARGMRGSVAVGVPLRRGSSPRAAGEGALEPTRDMIAAAVSRATLSWQKPVADGRVRIEQGQGETWVLIASPCGADGESDADTGLTALFTIAALEMAKTSPDARVEPWVVPDGAGLLVHGPAVAGETASAQARRLADVVARSFASEPITIGAVTRARAGLLHHDLHPEGAALGAVGAAVAPGHASWFDAFGRDETIARSADASVLARGQALRAGPLRVAVLANVDAAQGEAALRAADRWIDRRVGDARACRASTPAAAPRPGTYAVEPRAGAAPEAYLAFPFAANDEKARAAATVVAAALDGDGGLLERAFGRGAGASADADAGVGGGPIVGADALGAQAWSARVVGWPKAPALVVRVVGTQVTLDGAVMQARALVDRVKKGGLAPADHERATAAVAREAVAIALDPRARIVATWRGDAIPTVAQPLPRGRAGIDDVRAFAAKYLGEETMVVVAARPPRAKPVTTAAP